MPDKSICTFLLHFSGIIFSNRDCFFKFQMNLTVCGKVTSQSVCHADVIYSVSIVPLGYKFYFTYYSPWRRKWQPTPVFLPGEFHG